MPKELNLYQKDELTYKQKFYILMDILLSNQSNSRLEVTFFLGFFYIQTISVFFAEYVGVFDPENSKSDKILYNIEKLFRVKDLFIDNLQEYYNIFFSILILAVFTIFHYLMTVFRISRKSFYSYNKILVNYYIKVLIYILYNIILDLCFAIFCIGDSKYNQFFSGNSCKMADNVITSTFSIITIILLFFLVLFLKIFFTDSFYLSESFYSKMNCNYDLYFTIHGIFSSFFLSKVKILSKELFLFYNLISSVFFFYYFLTHFLYYDRITNLFSGIFHTLFLWSSFFSFLVAYLDFREKGIVYLGTSIVIGFIYVNIRNKLESEIFLRRPFFKIKNKFYLLHYFRTLFLKINSFSELSSERSFLSALLELHANECVNQKCPLRKGEKIYLPLENEWGGGRGEESTSTYIYNTNINDNNNVNKNSNKSKYICDPVLLKTFTVIVMNDFLNSCGVSSDMYLNLSLYYLKFIGNYCQSMYYYRKINELNLSVQEQFMFNRLHIKISNVLTEKLRSPKESVVPLEYMNISLYYKYDSLSQKFLDEISNDINLSLDLWRTFKGFLGGNTKKLDFNKVFELTDRIRLSKIEIEKMWSELLRLYSGVNSYFDLYIDYTEQINDDDLRKRELESLKRRNENFSEHLNGNYYYVLFNKSTGVMIVNGDRGNEGTIELCDKEIEQIFKFKICDLKGVNVTSLMPRVFAKDHNMYIERFFKVGEKKIIDRENMRVFAKDRNNSIIKLRIGVKLFPILNESVYFCSMMLKENLDDIIFMDSNFVIQGMSTKLMKILNIENKFLFQDNNIPFYVICKKFVNFYNIFLRGKKKSSDSGNILVFAETERNKKKTILDLNNKEKINAGKQNEKDNYSNQFEDKQKEKEEIHENVEINENVELEYEIKLPQFLIDYSDKTSKNEAKLLLKLMPTVSDKEDIINQSIDNPNEEEELDPLIKYHKNNNETPYMTPGLEQNTTPGNTPNEEKVYKQKIMEYINLFKNSKFKELEDLIDTCNKESKSIEYKFNFTFDKFIYDNKNITFIVRCIDNKNDIGNSQEESILELNQNQIRYKKLKADAIKPLFELFPEEKNEILSLPEKFIKLSLENKNFQKILRESKSDLVKISKVHGEIREDNMIEDENSSQSSQAGFDSGLIKKNRIEEIRRNILSNVSNYYTINYIRIAFLIFLLSTIIFVAMHITKTYSNHSDVSKINSINTYIYQISLLTSDLVGSFISMRVLLDKEISDIKSKNGTSNDTFNFIPYILYDPLVAQNNKHIYYYYAQMHSLAETCLNNISNIIGILELELAEYLEKDNMDQYFWNFIDVSYINTEKNDNESYPMAIAQMLSAAHSFLFKYDIKLESLSDESYMQSYLKNESIINYLTYIVIENTFNNIFPEQIKHLLNITVLLQNYTSSLRTGLVSGIIIYVVINLLCIIAYYIFIQLTYISMTEGLKKVSKIRLEKIDEIIKKIEIFNNNLKKFKEKRSNIKVSKELRKSEFEMSEFNYKIQPKLNGNIKNNNNKTNKNSNNDGVGFNTEGKHYVPLKILRSSYIRSLFLLIFILSFVILIYLRITDLLNYSNNLIIASNYIFGKLIASSYDLVDIKCFMSGCEIKSEINYTNITVLDNIQQMIKAINIFDNVSEFYNYQFLLNGCKAAIIEQEKPEEYAICMEDSLMKSANNTDNILTIIQDYSRSIKKDYIIKSAMNANFNKRKMFGEKNFFSIEYMYYKYILPVGDNFAKITKISLYKFLGQQKIYIMILMINLGMIGVIYTLLFMFIFINKIVHYLCVSRCIMKIIPISVITTTQELETWIEDKF